MLWNPTFHTQPNYIHHLHFHCFIYLHTIMYINMSVTSLYISLVTNKIALPYNISHGNIHTSFNNQMSTIHSSLISTIGNNDVLWISYNRSVVLIYILWQNWKDLEDYLSSITLTYSVCKSSCFQGLGSSQYLKTVF